MMAADIDTLLKRRGVAVIARDQAALLDAPNAWASDLETSSQACAQVPAYIIEAAKHLYVRVEESKRRRIGGSPKTALHANSVPAASPQELDGSATLRGGPPETQSPASSPAQPIEWSRSPSPNQQEIPRSRSIGSAGSPNTLRPAIHFSKHREFDVALIPPSSETEEALEEAIPEGLQLPIATPVNIQSVRFAPSASSFPSATKIVQETPPCAQPNESSGPEVRQPVPSTPSALQSRLQKHKKMKEIIFSEDRPRAERRHVVQMTPASKSITAKNYDPPLVTSSLSTSSGSVIPSTNDEIPDRQASLAVRSVAYEQSLSAGSPANGYPQAPNASNDHSAALQPPENALPEPEGADIGQKASMYDKLTDPYAHFKMVYPEYESFHSGSLSIFLTACGCLWRLDRRRRLLQNQFDDFIRAFSSGYVPYVDAATSQGEQAMSAFEWINEQLDPVQFTRMAVTRDSLDAIFNAYPDFDHRKSKKACVETVNEESVADEQVNEAQLESLKASPTKLSAPIPSIIPHEIASVVEDVEMSDARPPPSSPELGTDSRRSSPDSRVQISTPVPHSTTQSPRRSSASQPSPPQTLPSNQRNGIQSMERNSEQPESETMRGVAETQALPSPSVEVVSTPRDPPLGLLRNETKPPRSSRPPQLQVPHLLKQIKAKAAANIAKKSSKPRDESVSRRTQKGKVAAVKH